MQAPSKIAALPEIGKAVGCVAVAALFFAVLSHSEFAFAAPRGGGGGFHGGGFHGGGFHDGWHGGTAGFNRDGFGGARSGHWNHGWPGYGWGGGLGLGSGLGLGLAYSYAWSYYPPGYGHYGDNQPYTAVQYWYYCSDPAGYYPYVTQCNTGWQTVPAG